MILVDTNVIIDFWKRPDTRTEQIFSTENIAVCGVIKSELLHGAHSLEDCDRILDALSEFPCLELEPHHWEILGRNLYLLRSHGITLPFQDVIIATIAILNQASLWSNDKHFSLIKSVLPKLTIYNVNNENNT